MFNAEANKAINDAYDVMHKVPVGRKYRDLELRARSSQLIGLLQSCYVNQLSTQTLLTQLARIQEEWAKADQG